MKWNVFEAAVAGAKGGAKTSEAKRRAARKNGKAADAGRPRKSSLAEHILRRKLTPEQHHDAAEGFFRLSENERDSFRKFFGLEPMQTTYVGRRGRKKLKVAPYFDAATTDGVRPTNPNRRMRMILRKFRITARHLLAGGR